MPLEFWSTLASFATFVVITATAIAAIVQLRHLRSSNQIAAFNELRVEAESSQFTAALNFVISDLGKALEDPAFRHQISTRGARTEANQALISKLIAVGNYFTTAGMLVKMGLIDRELAVENLCTVAVPCWEALEPVVAIVRRGGGVLWENFEYFTVLSQEWITAHPEGAYPPGVRRLEVKDKWREADARYAASLLAV